MANIFITGDPHAMACWTFASDPSNPGSVEPHDIINGTLSTMGCGLDSVNFKEGEASGNYSGFQSTSIVDAWLPAGFPFKNGDTTKLMSAALWFKPHTFPGEAANRMLACKREYLSDKSWRLFIRTAGGQTYVGFGIAHAGGTWEDVLHASALTGNRWYHVGLTFNDTTHAYRIRLWDDTAGAILGVDKTGAMANDIDVTGGGLFFGSTSVGETFDGNLDEMVFFNDILDPSEIDQIRGGLYLGEKPRSSLMLGCNM